MCANYSCVFVGFLRPYVCGAIAVMLLICGGAARGQQKGSLEELYQQLEREETTDSACEQLLKLTDSAEVRQHLESRVSPFIYMGPGKGSHVWDNMVELAGVFRVEQAVVSLGRWTDVSVGVPQGPENNGRLENRPAAQALVKIGDASVPVLTGALRDGTLQQRWIASRALHAIGSKAAVEELVAHFVDEPDPELRMYIREATGTELKAIRTPIRLFDGYQVEVHYGFEANSTGKYYKDGGLVIDFTSGLYFGDQADKLSKNEVAKSFQQVINGVPGHFVITMNHVLVASIGLHNFHVAFRNDEELTEALLMLATFDEHHGYPIDASRIKIFQYSQTK